MLEEIICILLKNINYAYIIIIIDIHIDRYLFIVTIIDYYIKQGIDNVLDNVRYI